MEKLFKFLFGQSFQSVVDTVQTMDITQQVIFIFWVGCVVMFYSVVSYLVYLIGKDLIVKLFTNLKIVK